MTDVSITDARELNCESLGTHLLRLVNYVSMNDDILSADGREHSRRDPDEMPYQIAKNQISDTHLTHPVSGRMHGI